MIGPSHILFVTSGVVEDGGTLAAALKLSRCNGARITVLVICPPLPSNMVDYQEVYETGLRGQVSTRLEKAASHVGVTLNDLNLTMEIDNGYPPSPRVLQYAAAHECDLIIKQADPVSDGHGFRSKDMVLVRKSKCPVALSRLTPEHTEGLRVGVAIDPEPVVDEGRKLSRNLLRAGRLLAESFGGDMRVISCWDYPFEDYLRRNPWFQVPQGDLSKILQGTQARHTAAMDALIARAKISCPVFLDLLKGQPEELIPKWVVRHKIDVLVLGSLERSAVSGLLIGSTSEDVLSQVGCSVLTLKPEGFVSPLRG
jgi:universal stress protein E